MRAAYWELSRAGGTEPGRVAIIRNPIVLGRKHCTGCGHWRHVCDFAPMSTGRLRPRCRACHRAYDRRRYATLTPAQREQLREYERFWREAQRRRRGVPVRQFRNRRSVVDRIEGTRLPLEPLLDRLACLDDGDLADLARRSGVSERALYRYRYAESHSVRIDVADRLAVAMGTTASLIWSEVW